MTDSGLSSQSFNNFLLLLWHNDLSPQIIDSPVVVETSKWTKFTMLKACKALGECFRFQSRNLGYYTKNGGKEEISDS